MTIKQLKQVFINWLKNDYNNNGISDYLEPEEIKE